VTASRYRVEVLAEQNAVTAQDVIELWLAEGVLDQVEAGRRAEEILVVASDRDGRPVGVSTTYLARNHQLRAELWHTRVFVATAHRQSHLAVELAQAARDHLCQRYTLGRDPRGIGVLFEVESEILKRFIPQAIWPRTQFVFIGENPRGDHLRVFYFPGALAPDPDGSPPGVGQGSA
jgi:hypothetical protein